MTLIKQFTPAQLQILYLRGFEGWVSTRVALFFKLEKIFRITNHFIVIFSSHFYFSFTQRYREDL